MSNNAVSDSACLIGLERIGRSDILARRFDTVFIPPAVQAELGYPLDWAAVKQPKNPAVTRALNIQIDRGESEAIALAIELADVYIVLDDKKARRIAQQLGLNVIGTIGLLLRGKMQGIITEVKPVLDALDQANFRISDPLYQRALSLTGACHFRGSRQQGCRTVKTPMFSVCSSVQPCRSSAA